MSTEESVIAFPAGSRTLALRESYLGICEGNACEAHLLNSNQRWYEYKLKNRQQARHTNKTAEAGGESPEADESLWVFMSAAEWVQELLGVYNEKTIRQKLEKLVERGFLATRSNPKRKWNRKPQWMFMRANVQAAVDAWEASRVQPDINPSGADELGADAQAQPTETAENQKNAHEDNSDISGNSIRKNVRMQTEEVPNALGESSASIRTNFRSNTTGIIHRDLSQESSTVVVEREPEIQATEPASATPSQVESPAPLSNNKNQAEPETAHPPVGGSADADITGEEIEFLFGNNHQVAVSVNDTETENVPPAAPPAPAAAQEAQEAPAVFAPGAESRAEVTSLLSARLGGKSRLKTLLSEPGRDNVRQKASWLDLEPARVRAIVEEAQAKCAAEGVTYVTAITRRLDAALGARDANSLAERPASVSATPGTLGAAYEVKPSVVVAELTGQASQPKESESPRKFVPGAEWRGADGQTVTIEGQEGARYLLSNGQKLLAFELMKAYQWIEACG